MYMCCNVQVLRLRNSDQEEVDDDLFSLACGPDFRIKKYSSCIVNGVRFNIVDRDKHRKTQNSGVMAQGTHNNQFIDFFGTLIEIIQLEYGCDERSVVLFKCDWFKLDGKRTELKDDGLFKSINFESLWYKDDSLILATQARKVFYLPDTRLGKNWHIVQTFDHRHLYNVSETEPVQYTAPAYQEDGCCVDEGTRQTISDIVHEKPLNRDDEQGLVLDATKFAQLMKGKGQEMHEIDIEEEDDTIMEYCSSEDEGTTNEVDSDDE
jgi:hypothetical protein